jgi:peptidoglycan/xylan/chitin deacetylase (PgdA/CDA1 family)
MLDIVMYHYVRPLKSSKHPKIKGLEIEGFKRQLNYFKSERSVVTTADVLSAIKGESILPKGATWLTFDDGYIDHIEFVAPLLEQNGFDGAFFPVADCYAKNRLLDVNKIHYILACIESEELLLNVLKNEMVCLGYTQVDWDKYWMSVEKASRYDSEATIFFKRMTQRELPLNHRKVILSKIFNEIVGRSESDVAKELYLSESDLISLHKRGFTIGSHTSSHKWLNTLSADEQKTEIDTSLSALKRIRGDLNDWIMCYPYGGYNEDTLSILDTKNCALALTTKVGTADFYSQHKYELKRLDTNDFPQ